jgi:hypothetical protein
MINVLGKYTSVASIVAVYLPRKVITRSKQEQLRIIERSILLSKSAGLIAAAIT